MDGLNLNLITDQAKEVEELRQKRAGLSSALYERLDIAEAAFLKEGATPEQAAQAGKQMKTTIDSAIAHTTQYKATIADLTAGLTTRLDSYQLFIARNKEYTKIEYIVSLINPTKADAFRARRIQNQSVQENLDSVLQYGDRIYQRICEIRSEDIKTLERLTVNTKVVAAKIEKYQPLEEALKIKLDALKGTYEGLQRKYQGADATGQRELLREIVPLKDELTKLEHEHTQAFTIYQQAKQQLFSSLKAQENYEQLIKDLGAQATLVREKLDNTTEVFKAVPGAVKTALITKGMEVIDATINASLEASLDMIMTAAEGVSRATKGRQETPTLGDDFVVSMQQRRDKLTAELDERFEMVRAQARRSQNEIGGKAA